MTPLEAIRSATLHGATYLGMDKDLGSLEVGKLADLMVMNDNPLDDIQSSQDILYVMKNGRLYDAETMNEIGNILHVQPASIYKQPLCSTLKTALLSARRRFENQGLTLCR